MVAESSMLKPYEEKIRKMVKSRASKLWSAVETARKRACDTKCKHILSSELLYYGGIARELGNIANLAFSEEVKIEPKEMCVPRVDLEVQRLKGRVNDVLAQVDKLDLDKLEWLLYRLEGIMAMSKGKDPYLAEESLRKRLEDED